MDVRILSQLNVDDDPLVRASVALYAEEIEEYDTSDPDALREIIDFLQEGTTYIFTEDKSTELLAVANISAHGTEVSLEGIAVTLNKRGAGIGSSVMRLLIDRVRAQEYERMTLVTDPPGVIEGDRLRAFYQKLGFVLSTENDVAGRMELDLR